MSRYRVDQPSEGFNTIDKLDIYGPEGQTLGYIFGSMDPASEVIRLKRFIEGHDEIVTVLRQIAEANGKWLVLEACADKLTSIISRIDGEEAQ